MNYSLVEIMQLSDLYFFSFPYGFFVFSFHKKDVVTCEWKACPDEGEYTGEYF